VFFRCDGLFHLLLECGERLRPKEVAVCTHCDEAFGIELVKAARAGGAIYDESSLLEDAQVLGDCGTANRQTASDLADGQRAAKQALQDGTAGVIAEGIKLTHLVSIH
jgi:hypothetical protein